jgi:hypothetical protein
MQPWRPILPQRRTRYGFRVAAGVLGAFILLVGLAIQVVQMDQGELLPWLFLFASLYGGVGLAVGAWTGRWYNAKG